MAKPNQDSIQESREESTSPNPIQVFYHVLSNVLKIKKHEVVSISKWIKYMGYNNFTDLCVDLLFELNQVHVFSKYIVDGQCCALTFGIMNKLKLLTRLMSTSMKDIAFEFLIFLPLPMLKMYFVRLKLQDKKYEKCELS